MTGKEAQSILTAVNLTGLPSLFYEGKDSLGLVSKQGDKYAINTNAEITQEIMRHINDKHVYGEKITGKLIEGHFGGIGYGWERDVLRLVLATLFRAGSIEISYQGKRYKSYNDPTGREAITNNNAFKVATFAPREKTISVQQLRDACLNYEAITGKEVDAEENAIAQALKEIALEKKEILLSMDAKIQAYDLPCGELVHDLLKTMMQLPENAPDDCVKYLADEGKALKVSLEKIEKIDSALSSTNIEIIKKGKRIISEVVYVLKNKIAGDDPLSQTIDRLQDNLVAEDFYDRLTAITRDSEEIEKYYQEMYAKIHSERNEIYRKLSEAVKGTAEWESLPEDMKDSIPKDINLKSCEKLEVKDSFTCSNCRATVMQMESDVSARDSIEKHIQQVIDDFVAKTDDNIEKIRLSEFFAKNISTPEEFKEQVDKFIQHIEALLKEGKKIIIE